jgi:hypothetical protein
MPLKSGLLLLALPLLFQLGCEKEENEDAAPQMNHAPPNEDNDEMCVICHTCGDDGTPGMMAPIIDQSHDVCTSCHLPDGSVEHHSEGCQWEMDCEADPPSINCNDCHTVAEVNDLCEECH